jgi:flagellar hook-associated protein 3 FlgL
MSVLPIPTTRVTDALASQRLLAQLQSNQAGLFRVQNQLTTGRRIFSPSDDAPAALRAINLQRIIERKTQLETNVGSSASYLAAAESAISSISATLNDVRQQALGVVDTLSTDNQRNAVIDAIDQALFTISASANTQFRDRYLFSGSRSLEPPFAARGPHYEYTGNEQSLRSHVDFGLLFDTGVPGSAVFGGISADIRGTTDFNPQVSRNTLLRDINGGAGISAGGAIEVVYTNSLGLSTSSVVSVAGAATTADVARFIEQGAPAGSNLTARVTSTGFELAVPSGTLLVREVSEGNTARELGLSGLAQAATLTGGDLNVVVQNTTPLDDLFGRRAGALLTSVGANNDILVTASRNGATDAATGDPLNGVTVQFAPGGTAGAEVATYDPIGQTLTISIETGVSTAAGVVAAINNEANGYFTAQLDPSDSSSAALAGEGLVSVAATATTSGGSGTNFDRTSGLVVTNGGSSEVVDFVDAVTVEDLLNRLNHANLGLQVEINEARTGINVRSRLSGADLTIGENGGSTASQLGIRSFTTESQLGRFNRGVGVPNAAGDGLRITVGDDPLVDGDGTSFSVDLEGAFTVGDVLDRINSATGNTSLVEARLTANGNGIELVDTSGLGHDLVVESVGPNRPAQLLGFVASDATTARSSTGALASEDRNTVEVDGIFNTLLRMRTALANNDVPALGREIQRLDTDLDRINFSRAEVGARLQGLQVLQYNLQDEQVNLRASLSNDLDVDLTEAITEFTNRQYALEASLKTAGSILRMSLLDYI